MRWKFLITLIGAAAATLFIFMPLAYWADHKIQNRVPMTSRQTCTEPPQSGPIEHVHIARRERPEIAELRAEAAKRNLYWNIMCVGGSFYGTAMLHPGDELAYIERGGKPHWFVRDETQ